MTKKIKNICVFASSSNYLDDIFYKDAQQLGKLLGENNYNIVYGGSKLGLMYSCAGAVKETGGKIIGIMPEKIANFGCANPEDCDEFILTAGMRERKAKLDEVSDAVIALAGGYGTLEELAEMIVQKQLAYNNKPIVILNTDGFYDKLIEFFEAADPEVIMTPEERKQLDELDDTVTVYRGVTSYNADNVLALSWSLEYDTANWFAHRFDEDGTVYQAQIDKKHILALFNGRNEAEVIVNPHCLTQVMEAEEMNQGFTQSM